MYSLYLHVAIASILPAPILPLPRAESPLTPEPSISFKVVTVLCHTTTYCTYLTVPRPPNNPRAIR